MLSATASDKVCAKVYHITLRSFCLAPPPLAPVAQQAAAAALLAALQGKAAAGAAAAGAPSSVPSYDKVRALPAVQTELPDHMVPLMLAAARVTTSPPAD